jgi:hypothetical protein
LETAIELICFGFRTIFVADWFHSNIISFASILFLKIEVDMCHPTPKCTSTYAHTHTHTHIIYICIHTGGLHGDIMKTETVYE